MRTTRQIYLDLRTRLDQEPLGFPTTKSGHELEILERLFTEEEAAAYLGLLENETLAPGEAFEAMVEKGLILRIATNGAPVYQAVPLVVGAFELQLRSADRGLGLLFDDFFREAFSENGTSLAAPARIVPASEARTLVMRWGKEVAVARCVCRLEQQIFDRGCDGPIEACLHFGDAASHVVESGEGRAVTNEEALEIVNVCERAGFVMQPFQQPGGGALCTCCVDCCATLRLLKLDPTPARRVLTDAQALVDQDECVACGVCTGRCPMQALVQRDADNPAVDENRCIGCGLCVTTCPTGALTLSRKPASERSATVGGGDYLLQLFRHELRDFIAAVEHP